jgi:hypothetical protein
VGALTPISLIGWLYSHAAAAAARLARYHPRQPVGAARSSSPRALICQCRRSPFIGVSIT